MPNCTEEIGSNKINFGRVGRRVVEGFFDGGSMTSDGSVMLLGETDRRLGLVDAAARWISDPRNPLLIRHAVRDMLRHGETGLHEGLRYRATDLLALLAISAQADISWSKGRAFPTMTSSASMFA